VGTAAGLCRETAGPNRVCLQSTFHVSSAQRIERQFILFRSAPLSDNKLKTRLILHRRWLILGLSLALTILTLYFVFRGIDRRVFERLITTQNPALLIAAALLNLLQISLGGIRWGTILLSMCKDRAPRLLNVQAVFYASIFFNYLPVGTVGGDVARILLARRFPLSMKDIVLSVLLDRILVVGALVILAVITLPSIAHPLAVRASIGCAAILLACAAGFLLLQPIERIAGRWRDVWLIASILRTAEELRRTIQRVGLLALFYALLAAAAGSLSAYCIALSLGIDIGLTAMIAIMSFVAFVTALPISLAGWGVREVSLVSLLGLLGVDREAALILSVEFGIICTLVSLPGGLIWLALRQHRDAVLPIK
jgi:glycosyltransferase 2 family protein